MQTNYLCCYLQFFLTYDKSPFALSAYKLMTLTFITLVERHDRSDCPWKHRHPKKWQP